MALLQPHFPFCSLNQGAGNQKVHLSEQSGTPLPNSTSPPSPAPMKSPIHLELTPCDSISTATSVKKPCPVNTSCDHLPHLDHPTDDQTRAMKQEQANL